MKWRRRVFALSLALGTGVLCFGPLLSHSISRRISLDWNADARLASARLSLANSSLAMSDLHMEHPEFSVTGKQIFLKLDTDRLWYRDCIIESMIGRGIVWTLNPTREKVSTDAIDRLHELTKAVTSLNQFEDQCLQKETTVRSLLSKGTELLNDIERGGQSRTQLIDGRIANLQTEVENLRNPSEYANPLRAHQRIESIKSEASKLQQLLAEDRLQIKEGERALQGTLAAVQEHVASASTLPLPTAIDLEALTRQLATHLLQEVELQLASYSRAGEIAFERLIAPRNTASVRNTTKHSFSTSDAGKDLHLPGIPPRMTRILKGRLSGQSIINGTREDIEMSILTSPRLSEQVDGKLSVTWQTPAGEGSTGMVHTQGTVQAGTDGDVQPTIRVHMHRDLGDVRMNLQSTSTEDRTDYIADVTLSALQTIGALQSLKFNTQQFGERYGRGTLQATSSELDSIEGKELQWEVSHADLLPIREWLETEFRARTQNRLATLEGELKTRAESESTKLHLRAQTIEAGMKERQQAWNQIIQALVAKAVDWEGQQLRANGNGGTLTR